MATAAPRTRKPTLLDEMMAEVIVFGGVPLHRATVLRIMQEDGFEKRACEMFALWPKATDYPACTYDEFRAIERAA